MRRAGLTIKFLPNLFYFILTLLLNPLIVVLELVLLILGLIPLAKVRSFVGHTQRLLTATAGDIHVFLSSPQRFAAIVGQVRRDLAWLAKRCEYVAIILARWRDRA
jgi:hypothetical protein